MILTLQSGQILVISAHDQLEAVHRASFVAACLERLHACDSVQLSSKSGNWSDRSPYLAGCL